MNTNLVRTMIVGAIVSALVTFGVISIAKPVTQTVVETKNVGAVVGPDITSEYLNVNGLQRNFYRRPFSKATSTVCAIKSPSSTSTVTYAGAIVTTSTTTAVTLRIATSTTAYATTTSLNYFSIASGALGSFAMTGTTSDASLIASPNTYLVFDAQGFIGADPTLFNGACSAVFSVL